MKTNNFKCLSLFDGISASQQAFKNMGVEFDGADNIYYSSEIDKYAIKNTQHNFPNTVQLGDVTKVNSSDFKDIDLVIGGSPCQSFSVAGNQKGFEDPRGQLFLEYIRILNEVKPKYFVFENVNSMSKVNKDIMTSYFGFEPTLINSSLVTAQNRKRIYFVGALQEDGTYKKVDISQPEDKHIYLKDILETGLPYQDKSHALTASYDGAVFWNSLEKKQRTMVAEPICVASGGRNIVDGKRQDVLGAKTEQRLEPNLNGKTNTLTTVAKDNLVLETVRLGHYNKGGQGDRIYSVEGKSVCLSANGGGRGAKTGLYKIDLPDGEYFVRKLTVNECCRLQDFPDGFVDTLSKTQGYKALGNSFTVGIIEHILKHLTF